MLLKEKHFFMKFLAIKNGQPGLWVKKQIKIKEN
jgi:hypothetical protein|tara:strand:- start:323 stop:424 length:102 start_codon:yes stop_codon:yes gene_type:complete